GSEHAPHPPPFPSTTLFRSHERHLVDRGGLAHAERPPLGRVPGAQRIEAQDASPSLHPGKDAADAPTDERLPDGLGADLAGKGKDRKSTRLNSSHVKISYAV